MRRVSLLLVLALVALAMGRASAQCGTCVELMDKVNYMLDHPENQKLLVDHFGELCKYLPDEKYQKVCTNTFHTYGPAVVKCYVDAHKLDMVCKDVIKGTPTIGDTSEIISRNNTPCRTPPSKDGCATCRFLTKLMYQYLKFPSSRNTMIKTLTDMCSHFEADTRPQCLQLMHTMGAGLYDKILSTEDPVNFCDAIGICEGIPELKHRHDPDYGTGECPGRCDMADTM